MLHFFFKIFLFIDLREGERGERHREKRREREREINLLFYFFMHSLVASCTFPDRRQNPQPWCKG